MRTCSLKDNFGYGESVLSMVFALNGVAVGALQLLGMRHLVRLLGKHMMLVVGNMFLAAGMVGVALSREPAVHFAVRYFKKKCQDPAPLRGLSMDWSGRRRNEEDRSKHRKANINKKAGRVCMC